jgi:hypothetical protein
MDITLLCLLINQPDPVKSCLRKKMPSQNPTDQLNHTSSIKPEVLTQTVIHSSPHSEEDVTDSFNRPSLAAAKTNGMQDGGDNTQQIAASQERKRASQPRSSPDFQEPPAAKNMLSFPPSNTAQSSQKGRLSGGNVESILGRPFERFHSGGVLSNMENDNKESEEFEKVDNAPSWKHRGVSVSNPCDFYRLVSLGTCLQYI